MTAEQTQILGMRRLSYSGQQGDEEGQVPSEEERHQQDVPSHLQTGELPSFRNAAFACCFGSCTLPCQTPQDRCRLQPQHRGQRSEEDAGKYLHLLSLQGLMKDYVSIRTAALNGSEPWRELLQFKATELTESDQNQTESFQENTKLPQQSITFW